MPVTHHLSTTALSSYETLVTGRPITPQSSLLIMWLRMTAELLTSIHVEYGEKVTFSIESRSSELYSQLTPIFGEEVSLKLPTLASDIAEAARCLALDRSTACVFHLMRVAEQAVQKIGKKLRIDIPDNRSWYQITIHINKAVDDLPAGNPAQRRRKQKFAAAAAHLNVVRIATRNDVMHPKSSYTVEEAGELFSATRSLLQEVAKLV